MAWGNGGEARGCVVLLCGPSSVGKTSTGRALQGMLPTFSAFWPQEAVILGVPQPLQPTSADAAIAIEEAAAAAYFGSLATYAQLGFVAIGETWFWGPRQWDAWRRATPEGAALAVRLTADQEVLDDREGRRGDIFSGTAFQQWSNEFEADYDVALNTGHLSPSEVAEAIVTAIRDVLDPSDGK